MVYLNLCMYMILTTNEFHTCLRYFKIQLYYKKQYNGTGTFTL
jgi:hypothetical protein